MTKNDDFNQQEPDFDIFNQEKVAEDKNSSVFSNFKAAVSELWNGKPKATEEYEIRVAKTEVPAVDPAGQEEPAEDQNILKDIALTFGAPEAPNSQPAQEPQQVVAPVAEIGEAIITADLVIDGSITATQSNINNKGTIRGNISGQHSIFSAGVIRGNIACANASFVGQATTIGNIDAANRFAAADGTMVIGDINAQYLEIDGRVKGDLTSGGTVILKSNSVVFGNITAKAIAIEQNAMIKGAIDVVGDGLDERQLFDESSRIKI